MSKVSHMILDFESNGVEPDANIIEVGVLFVDEDDTELFEYETLIHDGDLGEVIESIEGNDFLRDMHGSNGLLDDLKALNDGIGSALTMEELDGFLCVKLAEFGAIGARSVILDGSGVSHFDQNVIKLRMPKLASMLQFYTQDVGQIRRVYHRSVHESLININDDKTHRALQDVRDHFEEWKAFRAFFVRAHKLIAEDDARKAASIEHQTA